MNHSTVRIAAAVLTSAGLLLTTACDGDEVKHGTVTAKYHRPETNFYQQQPITARQCGYKGRNCRTVVTGYRRVLIHQNECWKLTLKAESGKTGSVCVGAKEYKKLNVGDKR